jgi:hypothetical protein
MERIKDTMKKPIPFEATRDGLDPALGATPPPQGLQPSHQGRCFGKELDLVSI